MDLVASVAPALVARGVRAGEIVKIAARGGRRRRRRARHVGPSRRPRPRAAAGGDRRRAGGDRSGAGSRATDHDAGAGARLRQRALWMRGQRPDRGPGHAAAAVPAPATRRGIGRLRALVAELGAERVIVGLPLSLSGADSAQTEETRAFAARLQAALPVPVELYDERFTTRLAERSGGRAERGLPRRRASARELAGQHRRRERPWLTGGGRTRRGARGGAAERERRRADQGGTAPTPRRAPRLDGRRPGRPPAADRRRPGRPPAARSTAAGQRRPTRAPPDPDSAAATAPRCRQRRATDRARARASPGRPGASATARAASHESRPGSTRSAATASTLAAPRSRGPQPGPGLGAAAPQDAGQTVDRRRWLGRTARWSRSCWPRS